MTKLGLQGAFDVIVEALVAGDTYSEEMDDTSREFLKIIILFVESAQGLASSNNDKIDDWHDAQRARRYPHPTAREKAEHNEP